MGTQESKPVQTTNKAQEVGKKVNPSVHQTGLSGAQTTTLFRAVNFELFVKPIWQFGAQHGNILLGSMLIKLHAVLKILYRMDVNWDMKEKVNKVVMAFGVITMTGCVAYIAYLNAVKENQKDQMMYEQYFEDGSTLMKPKKSKWD